MVISLSSSGSGLGPGADGLLLLGLNPRVTFDQALCGDKSASVLSVFSLLEGWFSLGQAGLH